MEEINKPSHRKEIDFTKISKLLFQRKKAYFYTLPIAFIVSCILILSIPRYYRCDVTLAPEWNDPSGSMSSSLSSLASSFGMNIGGKIASVDAISPELYPNLLKSTDFKVSLFPIHVVSKDKSVSMSYYQYLNTEQKAPWWEYLISFTKNIFKKEASASSDGKGKINSFWLSKEEYNIVEAIGNKISCNVDKKNNVITISVEDQDPLIAATMADSVKVRLQKFITDYRTSKARTDLEYTKKLYVEAKTNYDKARQKYADYSDANQDVILESYKAKINDLENEMQLKYNIYSMLTGQLQQAYAKVQERTPAFTTLSSASVPLKPAGPKRMIFVAAMLFVTFLGTSFYILFKYS